MTEGRTSGPPGTEASERRGIAHKLGATAWSLFFIWIGIALLAGISIGVSLLVVGCVTLLVQLARKLYGLRLEGVWMVVGCLFVIGGLSDLLGATLPLLPILILVAGVALLISTLVRRHSAQG